MRKLFAWLGAAASIVVICASAHAGNGTALKPYVTLILDTSGSMTLTGNCPGPGGVGSVPCGNPTGFGSPSCGTHCSTTTDTLCATAADCPASETCVGQVDNKLDHAKCAINQIANSYGDMVLGLGRYRTVDGGTLTANGIAPTFAGGNGCTSTPPTCTANDEMFELLSPLVDGHNATAATFTNFTANTCTPAGGSDPEIWTAPNSTPLGGALLGVQRYYKGLQATNGTTILAPGSSGFDPIVSDPTNSVFLPEAGTTSATCDPNPGTCTQTLGHCSVTTATSCEVSSNCPVSETCVGMCTGSGCCCASQCRPYIVILLTDGDEECGGNAAAAATALFSTAPHSINLSSLTRATNVVTARTATANSFAVNDYVVINGANPAGFDGVFKVLTVATATRFTYAQTGTDGTAAALAGSPFYAAKADAIAITSVSLTGNVVTVTTASAHTLLPTQKAIINGTGATLAMDGTFAVLAVPAPDATHFSYALTAANVAATAPPAGAICAHAAIDFKYQIQTEAIGFGVTPGDAQIEAIAHAGGAADVPGVNEGYYASDQLGLELAISQIIAKSLRTESCNGLDDDCDGKIDEDFPTLGQPCDNGALGACKVTGTLVCSPDTTGVVCSAGAGPAPGVEICNGLDDDCDGKIDEGLVGCTCSPQAEICDGVDQDCDNHIDQSCRCSNDNTHICKANGDCGGANTCVCTPLTRTCGQGTCLGVETCDFGGSPSNYIGCTAPLACSAGHCSIATATTCTVDSQCPAGQTCNTTGPDCGICDGKDNDCDGVCDGFSVACSNIGNGDPTNNLGDPSHNPIVENVCHPGEKTCPQSCAGTNSFGGCLGEVEGCNPTQDGTIHCDTCDGIDNDCDNKIDEDFVPAPCSGACGVGVTQCINGVVSCNAMPGGSDDTCNGIDEDCDGRVDEGWTCDPSPGCTPAGPGVLHPCCICGTGTLCNGVNQCINGMVQCTGSAVNTETCNCLDDDCDGIVDENVTCPGGGSCVNCQCAFACSPGEFPCPLGKKCNSQMFCVNDPCFNVTCPAVNGIAQSCRDNGNNTATCVDACTLVTCLSPLACFPPTGTCLPDDCSTYPDRCTADQNCINGNCVTNLCKGVVCPSAQYCVSGQCYSSCADVDCPGGQRCRLGTCETDPCGVPCAFGKACDDATGVCIDDPCLYRDCPQGQWCNPNDGNCEDDPCVGTKCPVDGQICKGGTCYDPSAFLPDGGGAAHVTVGGGGCSTTGNDGGGVLLLGAVAMALARRRRERGRS